MGAATREEAIQQQCREFVMRFQQLTAPVMAKGLEDSAFYNFNRLISLNEVGGDPDCFGVGVEEFHRDNLARAERWPHSMLATSTHDTKRGEDARARINVLSEVPEEWGEAVRRWRGMNEKSVVDGEPAPCPNDEYLLYQTLIGVWPMEADWVGGGGALDGPKVESRPLTPALSPSEGERERLRLDAAAGRGMAGALSPSEGGAEKLGQPVCGGAEEERGAAGKAALRERVSAYMLKAIREAKTHTSWTEANLSYEKATVQFVEKILDDSRANQFLEDFGAFQRRIAFFGVINSLAQTLLKLTCPGVPDFYQGTELWDFSLVDPDNRRPVDYQLRRRILEMVRSKVQNPKLPHASRFWVEMGAIKLRLIWQALDFRRRHPEVFEKGAYVPLLASGSKAGHVCAFARVLGKETVVAVAPRLVVGLTGGLERWPLKDEIWLDTEVELPSGTKARGFANALTGERVRVENGAKGSRLRVGELLESLPVALMHEQG
jgi:(1->4)-alpha-D-glucan 1-alpha-D-glucosylmutase